MHSWVCCIHDVTTPPLQEQRCRQGDDSLLQKALDESRRESQSGTHEVSLKMRAYEPDSSCVCVCVVNANLYRKVGESVCRWQLAGILRMKQSFSACILEIWRRSETGKWTNVDSGL